MNKSNIILIVTIIILIGTTLFSFLFWPSFFGSIKFTSKIYEKWNADASFHGDGAYTMKNRDDVMLNNRILIGLSKIDKLEYGTELIGSPVGVYKYPPDRYKYPGGTEVGTLLVVNNSRFVFLSPTNSEQQIIERGNNEFAHPGVVMKLISLDKDKREANISFRSITGNINLANPFLVIPIAIMIQALLVFMAEFIIKRKSTNVLYRHTFYRSIIYTVPILLLASFSDPMWGILLAFIIFPVVLIESIIVSFVAYRIAVKRKFSN